MVKVMNCIVEQQRSFFDKGLESLRPLTLQQVASQIGMHESTVSRVTTNKYVQTPRGVFELKYFFSSGLETASGEDMSAKTARDIIQQLIDGEEKREPLSDQRIADILHSRRAQDRPPHRGQVSRADGDPACPLPQAPLVGGRPTGRPPNSAEEDGSMEVQFTARHCEVPAELRDYVTRKVEKLMQYHDGIREARVILSTENYRHIAEVTLLARRRDFVGREESPDMQSSVDTVIDKLTEQLKRFKEKRASRGRRSGRQSAYALGPAAAAPQITFRDTMEMPESLTVEQALAALDDEGGEILVFENAATRKTTVIYRREDGSYGLIEPAG